ncbi:hypothetical protein E4U43_001622 [Claviceps pusilla]|uniref:Uncharacterized protein n=1 Tax=Claviceps pusilla TaxID=123648 RepID=A0A9P7N9X5_9HYPO|nr:hypothetical protein E4U43_001622 [Claviceps pusilla]
MPSRPELQLSLPSSRDVRRPRFHEDFDAPFSEALLSPAPLSPSPLSPSPLSPALTMTTSRASSPSSEHPGDMSLQVHVSYAPRPLQSREHSWSSTCSGSGSGSGTDSGRNGSSSSRSRSRSRSRDRSAGGATGVNDRIRDWARRSFLSSRRPDDDGRSSRCS